MNDLAQYNAASRADGSKYDRPAGKSARVPVLNAPHGKIKAAGKSGSQKQQYVECKTVGKAKRDKVVKKPLALAALYLALGRHYALPISFAKR